MGYFSARRQAIVPLPRNRLREDGVRVGQLCEKYDLPHNSASLPRQLFRTQRIVHGLGVPEWVTLWGRHVPLRRWRSA